MLPYITMLRDWLLKCSRSKGLQLLISNELLQFITTWDLFAAVVAASTTLIPKTLGPSPQEEHQAVI